MGVKESTFKRIARVTDELIQYSPATAMKIHQLGYDDVEKIEAELNAMERPEYKERREQLERMNNVIKTSNMVDIVRCKDCKHRGHFENKSKVYPDYVCPARCEDDYYSWIPNDNWFCANGEKHDD